MRLAEVSFQPEPFAAAVHYRAAGVCGIGHERRFVLLRNHEYNPAFKNIARFEVFTQFRFRRHDGGIRVIFAGRRISCELAGAQRMDARPRNPARVVFESEAGERVIKAGTRRLVGPAGIFDAFPGFVSSKHFGKSNLYIV